jgi:assimilatory nitrate reductase catalytic subunit
MASQQRYGRDSVGCFGGGGLTNEKAYQLGKFARVALRTSQIDYNGRFCMSCAAAATTRAFGLDRGLPFPLSDIAEAEVILLIGSNPADTMPPAMQWFDEGRSRGATHIAIDPKCTATARGAKLHLQPVPGTDLALANGLLHLVIKHGYLDTAYIADRTRGFEHVRRAVRRWTPPPGCPSSRPARWRSALSMSRDHRQDKEIPCTPRRGSCRAATPSKGRVCASPSRSIPP